MAKTQVSRRRRRVAAVIAAILTLAIVLTGTYAWVAINQGALNEKWGGPNPGGRIHDDYDGENKDVYAENYGARPLFVRIRMDEYMEVGSGAGLKGSISTPDPDNNATSFVAGANINDKSTWTTHIPDGAANVCDTDFHDYVAWNMGGDKIFMPTFNQSNISLKTDASGKALDEVTGGQTAAGGNDGSHNFWADGDPWTDNVVSYDKDAATEVTTPGVTQTAKSTLLPTNGGFMTMAAWIAAGNPTGNFWVYDADGWAYWADALLPGDATSLLLSGIDFVDEPNDDWYYAINVVGQFVTLDDLSAWNSENESMTDDAISLIDAINAVLPGPFTVTFNANGGTGAPTGQTKDYGVDLTLTTVEPTRSGFTFLGWALSDTAAAPDYLAGGNFDIDDDTELFAVWQVDTPPAPTTYEISFNANGGSGAPTSQTKEDGVDLTLTTAEPTWTGHDFLGWALTDSGAAAYQPGGNFDIDDDTELFAVWALSTYTISFDANGGEDAPTSMTKTHGVDLTLPTDEPTYAAYGYTFLGWSGDSTTDTPDYFAGGNFDVDADMVLFAVWEVSPG